MAGCVQRHADVRIQQEDVAVGNESLAMTGQETIPGRGLAVMAGNGYSHELV